MARTVKSPGKGKIKANEIVDALLNSEIPEIRDIVTELSHRTRQLEEHSRKLQTYADKIKALTGHDLNGASEADLIENLRGLGKRLTAYSARTERPEFPQTRTATGRQPARMVEESEGQPEQEPQPERPRENRFAGLSRVETTLTPEGFIVKKRRF